MKLLDDQTAFDWSDWHTTCRRAETVLRGMAADKAGLRELLLSVENDPARLNKCECHPLDDKIVLYNASEDRNFRIRFRLATTTQDERPHTHRFSFATLILRGTYYQTLYRTTQALDDNIDADAIEPVTVHEAHAGSVCMIHHSTIHSTIATPDTISLILRGPARKKRAIIVHKESRQVSWRYGEQDESEARRRKVRMPLARYHDWCRTLLASDVV